MKQTLLIWVAFLCFATNFISAQDAAVNKIIEIGQTDNQVMNHLDVLTNRIGGRVIGSNAYDNAVEWVAHQFKEWGLEVEIQEAGTLPVGFNRGPWFGKLIGEKGMDLHFVTPSYTAGTKGVQRGHVLLEPRTQEEFNQIKGQLKGAWVLVNGESSGWTIDRSSRSDSIRKTIIAENEKIRSKNWAIIKENRKNRTNNPLLEMNEKVPALFYKEMCEAGVLGFIQSAPVPLCALYDRTIMTDPNFTFDNLPTVCDIKLDEHQYKIIKQMAKERRTIFLEFDIRNHFRMGPVKYHNVIGKIKGSKYPNEYVIASGHLDAFDVATGGVDCGSGLTSVMEAARMIKKSGAKPKRTMLFCAFAGEEFGLLGALAWAKANKDKLEKISNVFNRDGGPLPPVGINVPKAMYQDFVKICEPIKKIRPDYPFEVVESKPTKKPTRLGGSDASVFAIEGIPAIGFKEVDFKGYNFDYNEIWHTERDTYTKSIPEYQEQAATIMAITTLGVANLDHQLSREGLYE